MTKWWLGLSIAAAVTGFETLRGVCALSGLCGLG